MESDSRMSDITNNLEWDLKDLLSESVNLVSRFFKQGLCTVRGANGNWKSFANQVTGGGENLFVPPFRGGSFDIPSIIAPDSEPIVTVKVSECEQLPVGSRMALTEFSERVNQLYKLEKPQNVTLAIDYMLDGVIDRYWLPCQLGRGEQLLNLLESHVMDCLSHSTEIELFFRDVPSRFQERLLMAFGPKISQDLMNVSNAVMPLLEQHCDITFLEYQINSQVEAMPPKARQELFIKTKLLCSELRRAANGFRPIVTERGAQGHGPSLTDTGKKSHMSVKVKLKQTREPKHER